MQSEYSPQIANSQNTNKLKPSFLNLGRGVAEILVHSCKIPLEYDLVYGLFESGMHLSYPDRS